MGKVRRVRQKYHKLINSKNEEELTKLKETPGLTYEQVVAGNFDKVKFSSGLGNANSDIFAGLNISLNNLNTSLVEDDKVSIRSTAKSIKYDANGKLLKKEEKRKLRHDNLMKRLDYIQQMKKESEMRNRKNKKKGIAFNGSHLNSIHDELPQLVKLNKKDNIRTVKKRGIEKVKKRQSNLLEDIAVFQKILEDPKFKSNPFDCISESINKKLLECVDKT